MRVAEWDPTSQTQRRAWEVPVGPRGWARCPVHSSFLGSLGCLDGAFRDRVRFGGPDGFGGAQRRSVEIQPVGGVHEAIEDGIGDGRIWDQLVPMLDGDLAGDDRGASAVTVVDDVEQVAALLRG